MFDHMALRLLRPPITRLARLCAKYKLSANQVTLIGFFLGILALPLLAKELYLPALSCILLNRLADGLDGALARITKPTDIGAYLDIVLDFIFYAAVILGFALADPARNSLAAAALLFSFMGTSASFLAFSIFAERRQITNVRLQNKGFYYLSGLTEGVETIGLYVLCCLLPKYFPFFALIFAACCLITTSTRILTAWQHLKEG